MREIQRLNRMFEISLYALVLVPFGMILFGSGVGPLMGATFGVGAIASFFSQRAGWASERHNKWWNTIILGYVAFAVFQLFTTETSVLSEGIQFVLVLTLIKLFSRLGERDELQVIALSFLMLAAATTVNEDVTFGLLFGVYVLIGTFTLAVFHLRSELRNHPRIALYGGAPINGAYVGVLAGISMLILAASMTIFFVFPRIGLGFFAQQSRDGVSVTGFSENVELGGHGAIRDNPEVVMRVEFPDGKWPEQELSQLHWRTMTFDEYDGRGWNRSFRKYRRIMPYDRDRWWDMTAVHPPGESRGTIQIYLEPLGTNVLPVLWPSKSLRLGTTEFAMSWGPGSSHLRRDAYGDVRHTMENEIGIAYQLEVAKNPVSRPGRVREPSDRYLQLPALSDRVRQLATRVGQTGSNPEVAERIEEHLQTGYAYTTDLPEVGADPIDAFLFEAKRGHCEYFATTMVLMLRANGVPARLVNGFLGGRWNDVGGYLAVRQGDAHSWVEYWDPDIGWRPADPTPAAELFSEPSVMDQAREYWDAMRLNWMKWIIEYDLTAQIEVFRKAASMLQPSGLDQDEDQRVKLDDEEDASDWRTALLIGGLATMLFFAFRRTRRRLRRSDPPWKTTLTVTVWLALGAVWMAWFRGFEAIQYVSGASIVGVGVVAAFFERVRGAHGDEPLIATFTTIERAAQKNGLGRRSDEGPAEFLQRLGQERPAAAQDAERFSVWYLRARFSTAPVEPDDIDRLRSLARRIASALSTN